MASTTTELFIIVHMFIWEVDGFFVSAFIAELFAIKEAFWFACSAFMKQFFFPKFPLVWSSFDIQDSPVLQGSSSWLLVSSAVVAGFVTLWVTLDAIKQVADVNVHV
ncbi:hypothetical protein EUTSA_v10022924mg [Eutrema salsugineum]|uniref:Uncharacterized protein n=1 Tax=Eutrema salsugineum TaxID=72664 RepID=V4M7T1_EUTSA|nr:hypothetical protein EUTSA_v10022924mg [Eutrema salsugineum]